MQETILIDFVNQINQIHEHPSFVSIKQEEPEGKSPSYHLQSPINEDNADKCLDYREDGFAGCRAFAGNLQDQKK